MEAIQAKEIYEKIKGSLDLKFNGVDEFGAATFTAKSVTNWTTIANELVNTLNIFIYGINGVFVHKGDDGKYRVLEEKPMDTIDRHVTTVFDIVKVSISPALTSQISKSIMNRLKEVVPKLDDNTIYFSNGSYDTKTGKFVEEKEPAYNHRRIMWPFKTETELVKDYKEGYDKFIEFLKTISEGDKDIQKQIAQMIGVSLLPTKQFRKAFFMVGQGGNGKSSLLDMISKIHGQEKISSITLENMTGSRATFVCYGLVNKTVNAIDDLSNVSLKENGILKTIISGGQMQAEVKGGKTFNFFNEATLIANGNAIPNFNDKGDSTAIMDRMVFIPLNHKFEKTPKGVEAARRLLEDDVITVIASFCAVATHHAQLHGLSTSQKSKDKAEEFEMETDSVKEWLSNSSYIDEQLKKQGHAFVENAYKEYNDWCRSMNKLPFGTTIFGKSILKNRQDLTKKRIWVNAVDRKNAYVSVKEFEFEVNE